MLNLDCGLTEPSLIWLRPGREVPCGFCYVPGTMSRLSISSPNVAGGGAGGSSFVCSGTTARTLNSLVPYFLSCSGSSLLHSSIPVESIRRASSASVETSPCAAGPFWWFCPSPSSVCHLRSNCPGQSLHHLPLPHPPHCRNLQDHSDCFW